MEATIKIDGETYEIAKVHDYGYLPAVELDDGTEWYLAENSETAGAAARKYWEDMANDDPAEFTCIVGEKVLVAWALGQWAGPGSQGAKSLDGWLDLCAQYPEEHFASYDGVEVMVEAICGLDHDHLEWFLSATRDEKAEDDAGDGDAYERAQELVDELGFIPTVAYRCN